MGDLRLIFEFFLKTYQENWDQHCMKLGLLADRLDNVSKKLLANRSAPNELGENNMLLSLNNWSQIFSITRDQRFLKIVIKILYSGYFKAYDMCVCVYQLCFQEIYQSDSCSIHEVYVFEFIWN